MKTTLAVEVVILAMTTAAVAPQSPLFLTAFERNGQWRGTWPRLDNEQIGRASCRERV